MGTRPRAAPTRRGAPSPAAAPPLAARGVLLDHDCLEAFAAFADGLNFTRAARALHLSQPAVHAQVARLAEAVGAPLYVRAGQRLALTADGARVAAFARELRERTARLRDELAGRAAAHPVVLCAGEGAYLYLLGDAIRAFCARDGAAAAARLRVLTRDADGTAAAVLAGEAHVGVAALATVPDGLEAAPLVDVGAALAVPAGHALARRARVGVADLAGARLVAPPAGRPLREVLDAALREAGVSYEVAVEATGWPLVLHFVALGLGVAVVNDCCAIPRGVVAVPLAGIPRQRYYVLRRRGAGRDPAADALRSLLLARRRDPAGRTVQLASASPDRVT